MSSARETDLNPRTYIGLSFPLKADNNNDFALTKNSLEQAAHNLKNLLLTYPGERIAQPEFGSKLRALCFEPDDNNLPGKLEQEVVRAVKQWLPYINILSVDTLTDAADLNKVFVTISYNTILNADTLRSITLDAGYTATTY
jgi:phage baseplate assembly protein W